MNREQDSRVVAVRSYDAQSWQTVLTCGWNGVDDEFARRRPIRVVASDESLLTSAIRVHDPHIARQIGTWIGRLHTRPKGNEFAVWRPGWDLLLDVRGQ